MVVAVRAGDATHKQPNVLTPMRLGVEWNAVTRTFAFSAGDRLRQYQVRRSGAHGTVPTVLVRKQLTCGFTSGVAVLDWGGDMFERHCERSHQSSLVWAAN